MKPIWRKGKKQGSVLFTVVSVMLVMVVFLMSTMVLTQSANRRAYYSYFETQAQYAAEAALDAVTNSAYTEKEFYQWVQDNTKPLTPGGSGRKATVTVGFGGTDIKFTNGVSEVACIVEPAENSVMVWDELTQAVHEQPAYKITATAHVGSGRNESEYTVVNYIYENYRVEDESKLPTPYNKASTTIFSWTKGGGGGGGSGPTTSLNRAVYTYNAGRTLNNVNYFGPQYSGMSLVPVGRPSYATTSADYTISTGNNSRSVGNVQIIGNIKDSVGRDIVFQNYGESAQIYGNICSGNKGYGGGYHFSAHISDELWRDSVNYTELPYVYVDGQLSAVGGEIVTGYSAYGVKGNCNVNMYCGSIDFDMNSYSGDAPVFHVSGDLYMYDPNAESRWIALDSNYNDQYGVDRFISDNVNRANTQWDDYVVGGNVICNNKYFEIGCQNGGGLTINGDLIFTNPLGTLKISKDTHVNGRVLCAGTLEGREHLKLQNGYTPHVASEEPGFYDAYGDGAYGPDYVGYKIDEDKVYSQRLMPFPLRIDEIFDEYYLWDIWGSSADDAATKMKGNSIVEESMACGHEWSITEVKKDIWVPHTKALKGKDFIPHYVPATDYTVTGYNWTHEGNNKEGFAKGIEKTIKYDESSGNFHKNIPVYYHNEQGEQKQENINALVVNSSCILDLEYAGAEKFILIDPAAEGHNNSDPLYIVLHGRNQNGTRIIVNNTATYDETYSSGTTYASESHVPDRREVYIFFGDGYGATYTSMITMSGTYGKLKNNQKWNIVSNPYYPGQAGWNDLPNEIKYAYEIVPNTVVFGEAGSTFSFDNGMFINAEIVAPESSLYTANSSAYQFKLSYRENPESTPYNPNPESLNFFSVGTISTMGIDTSTNWNSVVYIGDANHPGSSDEPSSSSTVENKNGKRLGQENPNYFNNDHLGAS